MKIVLPSKLIKQGYEKKISSSRKEYFQLDENLYIWDDYCGFLTPSDVSDIDQQGKIHVQCSMCKASKFGFFII